MNLSHSTEYPQLPGKVVKVDYTGTHFVCKSGKQLKVRKVEAYSPALTITLFVPKGITRQNRVLSHTGVHSSQWILQLNGISLYFRDRDGTPVESLLEAVQVLYNMEDAPASVIKALKTDIKQERQRKNINTNLPGISINSSWNNDTKTLGYTARCSININGVRYIKDMSFDWKNTADTQLALSVMTSFRQQLLQHRITKREDVDSLLVAMKRGLVKSTTYDMPPDIMRQLRDNVTMRMSMLTGKGWTNPYNGEHIDSY